jgi:acetyl-CoA/propionyl-CoA carboxylase biotin carboxyl carrier protein
VQVIAGGEVTAGQPLLIVEAMKMEHVVTAPADGTVVELRARIGQQVRLDETLAVIYTDIDAVPGRAAPAL